MYYAWNLDALPDKAIYRVGSQLGKDWRIVGIQLGVSHCRLEILSIDHGKDIEAAANAMLTRYGSG